jgi:hypothetical protein
LSKSKFEKNKDAPIMILGINKIQPIFWYLFGNKKCVFIKKNF